MTTKPKGLYYVQDAISVELLLDLEEYLSSDEFNEISFNVNPDNPQSRLVAHLGFKYDYNSGDIFQKTHKFPKVIRRLRKTILKKHKFQDEPLFNQCIINRYLPGQGIGSHTDKKEYGDEIACFTIGGGAEMIFTMDEKTYKQYVEESSMYLMTGESRKKWKHQMPARKSDPNRGKRKTRWSLTFRTVSK